MLWALSPRTTISISLFSKSGTFETLKVLTRCGLSPRAFHSLCTVVRDSPQCSAMVRFDQWVASGGVVCSVPSIIWSIRSWLITGLRPRPSCTSPTHSIPSVSKWSRQAVTIAAEPGSEVVQAWPTFPEYATITALAGARARRVPLTGARHDVAAMAEAVTEQTRVVFVCNPNNPTGTALTRAELAFLLDTIPSWCLVVVDEAYAEFADPPEFGSALELLGVHENLLVLRTFSKAYGLAGLRVGYGVTDVEVDSLLRLVRIPFGVGSIALAAAVASIDAGPELVARVAMVQAERDRVATQLTGLGWEIPSSQANFLWIAAGEAQATAAACLCAESKVLVRQLPGGLRVTIGTEKENARLLDALGSPADLPPTRSAAGGSASRADPCSSSPLISS